MDENKLRNELKALKIENAFLKRQLNLSRANGKTVFVPDHFKELFDEAEKSVSKYFEDKDFSPENGEIIINGERYVLMRAAALSFRFWDVFKELYSNYSEDDAAQIANNFLFDIAHVLGREDAKAFHSKLNLSDEVQKLSVGPVHFAYTGWANVEILADSKPEPNDNFYLKFHHHNSFEAQSWIKAKRKSKVPVCIMNSGYSSGWCEASFRLSLSAVEISCEAKGDKHCTFIMAPSNRIQEYLEKEQSGKSTINYEVPVFFQRKYNEEKLKQSLSQKETLLKEVHHRVKNNLQLISSLLNLQKNNINDARLRSEFTSSISRVNTMARIHEMIYGDKNVAAINVEKYLSKLLRSLSQLYNTDEKKIELSIDIKLHELSLPPEKAIPLGLILNEIASNSFKYAFPENGVFTVRLNESEGKITLIAGDNGVGLPENLGENTLGLSLIPILCEQIDAQLEVHNSPEGLYYHIRFVR